MTGILIAAVYILILAGCGFLVSRLLRTESVFAELGLTFIFGTAVFLLLSNAFGYILPIRTAFATALALVGLFDLAAVTVLLTSGTLIRPPSDAADRFAAQFLFLLTLVVGLAGARYVGSDPWSWQHFPLASTIVAGNFPVHSPIDPTTQLRYHYAPALLAAGFRLLTGLPLSVGFALQPLIGGAGILFFSAALVRRYRPARSAVIAAVLALAGSGLVWLKLPELHAIILAATGLGPLRPALSGLADLVGSPITTSPLIFLGHRSTATGFPLLFGLLYVLSIVLDDADGRKKIGYGVLVFMFALALTLTMEIAFVTVSIAAVIVATLFLLQSSMRPTGLRMTFLGLFAFLPALLIALVQGGVLSGVPVGGHGSFVFHPSFSLTYDTFGDSASIFSGRFLRDFGLPLFLFPFALTMAWRSRRAQPIWLFVAVLALVHFVLPFLFDYQLIRGEMHRAFYEATSLMAMLAGIWISDFLLVPRLFGRRVLGSSLLLCMLFSGTLYLILRLAIPTMRFEPAPLFAGMPQISVEKSALYGWVRTHTTLSDYFYVRNLTVDFETLPDETAQMRDRVLFTTYTGRYTVGPIIFWSYAPSWLADVRQAELTCDAGVMKKLGVHYLLIETPDRASWFALHCHVSDWVSVYKAPGDTLPKIFELR